MKHIFINNIYITYLNQWHNLSYEGVEIRTSSTRLKKYLWHNYCEFWSDIIFVVFKLLFFLILFKGIFYVHVWITIFEFKFKIIILFIYFLNQKSYYQKYKICVKFYFHFRECTRSDVRESRRKTGICVVRKELGETTKLLLL